MCGFVWRAIFYLSKYVENTNTRFIKHRLDSSVEGNSFFSRDKTAPKSCFWVPPWLFAATQKDHERAKREWASRAPSTLCLDENARPPVRCDPLRISTGEKELSSKTSLQTKRAHLLLSHERQGTAARRWRGKKVCVEGKQTLNQEKKVPLCCWRSACLQEDRSEISVLFIFLLRGRVFLSRESSSLLIARLVVQPHQSGPAVTTLWACCCVRGLSRRSRGGERASMDCCIIYVGGGQIHPNSLTHDKFTPHHAAVARPTAIHIHP